MNQLLLQLNLQSFSEFDEVLTKTSDFIRKDLSDGFRLPFKERMARLLAITNVALSEFEDGGSHVVNQVIGLMDTSIDSAIGAVLTNDLNLASPITVGSQVYKSTGPLKAKFGACGVWLGLLGISVRYKLQTNVGNKQVFEILRGNHPFGRSDRVLKTIPNYDLAVGDYLGRKLANFLVKPIFVTAKNCKTVLSGLVHHRNSNTKYVSLVDGDQDLTSVSETVFDDSTYSSFRVSSRLQSVFAVESGEYLRVTRSPVSTVWDHGYDKKSIDYSDFEDVTFNLNEHFSVQDDDGNEVSSLTCMEVYQYVGLQHMGKRGPELSPQDLLAIEVGRAHLNMGSLVELVRYVDVERCSLLDLHNLLGSLDHLWYQRTERVVPYLSIDLCEEPDRVPYKRYIAVGSKSGRDLEDADLKVMVELVCAKPDAFSVTLRKITKNDFYNASIFDPSNHEFDAPDPLAAFSKEGSQYCDLGLEYYLVEGTRYETSG